MQILQIASATLIANLLTAMFVWGVYRAAHTPPLRFDATTAASLLFPLGFALTGLYLFAK